MKETTGSRRFGQARKTADLGRIGDGWELSSDFGTGIQHVIHAGDRIIDENHRPGCDRGRRAERFERLFAPGSTLAVSELLHDIAQASGLRCREFLKTGAEYPVSLSFTHGVRAKSRVRTSCATG